MLKLEDIDLSVDYEKFGLLESHLMHEVKRKGVDSFVQEYCKNIEEFKKSWSKMDFCFLLALLGYLDSSFKYDDTIKLDKFVLDPYSYYMVVELGKRLCLFGLRKRSIKSFRKRGFLLSEIGEAI